MFDAVTELKYQIDQLEFKVDRMGNIFEKENISKIIANFKKLHYGKPITDAQLTDLINGDFRFIYLRVNSKFISNGDEIHVGSILLKPIDKDRYELHGVLSANQHAVNTIAINSIIEWNTAVLDATDDSKQELSFSVTSNGITREKKELMESAWRIFIKEEKIDNSPA